MHNKVTGVSGPKGGNTINQEAEDQKWKWGRANPPELANPKAANSTQNPMDWKVLYSTFVKR